MDFIVYTIALVSVIGSLAIGAIRYRDDVGDGIEKRNAILGGLYDAVSWPFCAVIEAFRSYR